MGEIIYGTLLIITKRLHCTHARISAPLIFRTDINLITPISKRFHTNPIFQSAVPIFSIVARPSSSNSHFAPSTSLCSP